MEEYVWCYISYLLLNSPIKHYFMVYINPLFGIIVIIFPG